MAAAPDVCNQADDDFAVPDIDFMGSHAAAGHSAHFSAADGVPVAHLRGSLSGQDHWFQPREQEVPSQGGGVPAPQGLARWPAVHKGSSFGDEGAGEMYWEAGYGFPVEGTPALTQKEQYLPGGMPLARPADSGMSGLSLCSVPSECHQQQRWAPGVPTSNGLRFTNTQSLPLGLESISSAGRAAPFAALGPAVLAAGIHPSSGPTHKSCATQMPRAPPRGETVGAVPYSEGSAMDLDNMRDAPFGCIEEDESDGKADMEEGMVQLVPDTSRRTNRSTPPGHRQLFGASPKISKTRGTQSHLHGQRTSSLQSAAHVHFGEHLVPEVDRAPTYPRHTSSRSQRAMDETGTEPLEAMLQLIELKREMAALKCELFLQDIEASRRTNY